ncbi:MAG: hypothetical protein ACRENE_30485, partial [Polyangiaceae bacterium]
VGLRAVDAARAAQIHPALDAKALDALDPAHAVRAKESLGGTGPRSVDAQIAWIRGEARSLAEAAARHGSLETIAARVFAEPLERA